MEHEGDNYTNRSWFFWFGHQRIIKVTGGLENKRTSGDHPRVSTRPLIYYYIIENGQNTEKSPGDLRRLTVTQTPVKDHQLTLMWKTLNELTIIIVMIIISSSRRRCQTICIKKGGRKRLTCIGDSVDASIRLEDYIEKCGDGLITATRDDTDNTKTSRTTITRKQKWKEKQLYRKPYEINWISPNSSTKQRHKNQTYESENR